MADLRLSEIAEKIQGTILQGEASLIFNRFNIDSRLTAPGELFFAIVAERDGHDFIPLAVERGAAGLVVSRKITLPDKDIAIIQVHDTLKALQALAKRVLSEHQVKVIGITGSIGKTTTKEFTFRVLSRKFRTLKSEGNFNNQLGLPLSLLMLREDHQVAVLEMAMSAPGEIRSLTHLSPPDIAMITNINPVHLQFFKSIDDIALAKKEILEGAGNGATAVLNGDDGLVRKIARDWHGDKLFFGLSESCDVRARNIENDGWDGICFELAYREKKKKVCAPFFYESYLYNLLAAAAAAFALRMSFEDVIAQVKTLQPLPMRGALLNLRENIRLIDDSYNSNPAALESTLKSLSRLPSKRKVAVLADMLELGEKEVEYHLQAGRQVVKSGWNLLVAIGPLSRHMAEGALSSGMKRGSVLSFNDVEEAAEKIWPVVQKGDLVLVKGSRKMKTERIVEKLRSRGS